MRKPRARSVHSFIPVVFAILFFSSVRSNCSEPAPVWREVYKDQNISVSRKEVPGSSLMAIRGEGIIDAPIARVATVVFDFRRAKEWMDHVSDIRAVRWLSPHEVIEYMKVDLPTFLVRDRDFVTRIKFEVLHHPARLKGSAVSAVDSGAPESLCGHCIRGDVKQTDFEMTSVAEGRKTLMRAEILSDPKGGIPKWIVNLAMKSWPKTAFKRITEQLGKQLGKSDLSLPPDFAKIIAELKEP